jgi:hypothetical protein
VTVPPAGQIADQLIARAAAMEFETAIVYDELVRPGWGSATRHGYPRVLYGLVMSAMAALEEVSAYAFPRTRDRTGKMERLLREDFAAADSVPEITVKLWRHVLMHRGDPQPLRQVSTGHTYLWLLHWSDRELPPQQQLTVSSAGELRVLNMALLPLLESHSAVARRLKQAWASDVAAATAATQVWTRLQQELQM